MKNSHSMVNVKHNQNLSLPSPLNSDNNYIDFGQNKNSTMKCINNLPTIPKTSKFSNTIIHKQVSTLETNISTLPSIKGVNSPKSPKSPKNQRKKVFQNKYVN